MNADDNPYETNSLAQALRLDDAPVAFPRRALFASLLVMLPWPMLSIAACVGLFAIRTVERSDIHVWKCHHDLSLAARLSGKVRVDSRRTDRIGLGDCLGVASLLPKESLHPRFHVQLVLVYQSLFSAIQAGLGLLIVLGKYC